MVQDFEEAHLIKQLVDCIEQAPYTLHRGATFGGMFECSRSKMGLGFSKPEDCDCGLDALLAEARDYIGDGTGDKLPRNYKRPTRVRDRLKPR